MILLAKHTILTKTVFSSPKPFSLYFPPSFLKRKASTLVFIEHKDDLLLPSSLSAVTAALELSKINNNKVHLCIIGNKLTSLTEKLKKINNINKIIKVDDELVKNVIAQSYSKILLSIFNANKDNYTHVIGPHSNSFKDVGFRFSSLIDSQPVSDVVKIENENTFVRPIYAGNAIAKLKTTQKTNVISVRATAFEPVKINDEENSSVQVEDHKPSKDAFHSITEFLEEKISKSGRPELSGSPRIVSGGRGLKSGENFELLYKLADKLNAAVGASRAAVDAGYVDNSLQVGQTGKIVAPELYVAVGISGAIQHLAGMKDSKTIVAINKDPDAPIFQVADYGLVGDLFKVVPELTEKL